MHARARGMGKLMLEKLEQVQHSDTTLGSSREQRCRCMAALELGGRELALRIPLCAPLGLWGSR